MTVTLLQLRTLARQRADLENSQYVTDSELNGYINNSVAELYDLLIGCYDSDYFIESIEFNSVPGQNDYQLPNGTLYSGAKPFYKLRGVDAKINTSNYFTLRPFNFNERNRNEDFAWSTLNGPLVRYRLVGDVLKFSPIPDGIRPVRVWYIPLAPILSSDSDTLKDLNAYHEYVVVDAAIKCRIKEELEIQTLLVVKEQLKKRIETMAQNRDAGNPESVSDIYAENNDYWFFKG